MARKKKKAGRPELLSVPQVAELLKVSRVAVLYAIQEGRLAAVKVGRQWVIRVEDLEAYSPRKYRRKDAVEK